MRSRQYTAQGDRMMKVERFSEAREAYDKAVRLDPTNDQARKGKQLAMRYVESRKNDTAGIISREFRRVKVSAQHSLMEAGNHIEKAEALVKKAEAQPGAGLSLEGKASVYEQQKNYLDQAKEHLLRANLLLAGLSAKTDTRAAKDHIAVLGLRVKKIHEQKVAELGSVQNVISAKKKRDNLTEVNMHVKRQKKELLFRGGVFY